MFTETALAGNPLAIVDADGLGDAPCRRSPPSCWEPVFVFEPRNAIDTARVRIFTPKHNCQFTAIPRSEPRPGSPIGEARDLLGPRAGGKRSAMSFSAHGHRPGACQLFELPKLPEQLDGKPPSKAMTPAVSSPKTASARTEPSLYSAGAPDLFVPVRSLDAVGRAAPGAMAWATKDGPATYVYASEAARGGSAYHAHVPSRHGGSDGGSGDRQAAAFAGVVRGRAKASTFSRSSKKLSRWAAKSDRARPYGSKRRAQRHDGGLGSSRVQRLAQPPPSRGGLNLKFKFPARHSPNRQAASVAAHWTQEGEAVAVPETGGICASGPAGDRDRPDGMLRLRGVYFETDFADYLAWEGFGMANRRQLLSIAALRGSRRGFPAR